MTKGKYYIGSAFLIGITYRLLMGLQGIDSTDVGFCMTFYQNIFTHPDALPNYFNYYLTGLLGGLWQLAFGQYGLLGFRLLETLTLAVAIALIYSAFRPWLTSTKVAVVAILLSFLFPSSISTFHYNTLSFLLVTASVYAIIRWHQNERSGWLAMAGLFIGISFFARFLNITLLVLTIVPFVRGCHESVRKGFVNVCIYACGILSGCLMIYGIMIALGHWPYFIAALSENFHVFGKDEVSYSVIELIGIYLKGYVDIALQIIAIVFIAWFYGDAGHLPKKMKIAIRFILLVVLFELVFESLPYLSAISICTLLLVTTRRLSNLAFYPLLCAYLFPLGSGDGISATFLWCGGLLIIPAACCYSRLGSRWQRNVVCALCLTIGVLMVYRMGRKAMGENSQRTKTTVMAIPGSLNVMTSPERAKRYQNEVARIRQYSEGNPLLVIANQAAELYYATEMLPFTGSTQLTTFANEKLTKQLERQHAYYQQLPIVVYLDRNGNTKGMEDFRKILRPWMECHNYQLAYKDADMEIYKTTHP